MNCLFLHGKGLCHEACGPFWWEQGDLVWLHLAGWVAPLGKGAELLFTLAIFAVLQTLSLGVSAMVLGTGDKLARILVVGGLFV